MIRVRRFRAAARVCSQAQAAVASGDDPGHGAFDRWAPAAVGVLPGRVGGRLASGGGLEVVVGAMVTIRPVLAVVQRARSGQAAHRPVKAALRCLWRPPVAESAVCPAGQATVPAAVSMAKSSRL